MEKAEIFQYKDFPTLIDLAVHGGLRLQGVPRGPILTATRDLANAWQFSFQDNPSGFPGAATVSSVLKKLLLWQKSESRTAQLTRLGIIIDNLDIPEDSKRILQKNIGELVRSFRELITDGISPEELAQVENLPVGVAGAFESFYNDLEVGAASFIETVNNKWRNGDALTRELLALDLRGQKLFTENIECIYLQGFYYITPIQARFFEALCRTKWKVIFLNNYDADVPEAYQIWRENPHFKNLDRTDISGSYPDKRYGWIFQEAKDPTGDSNVTFVKFNDMFSFIRDWDDFGREHGQDAAAIYYPSGKEIRKIANNFFTKNKNRKYLLSYPLGQYLGNLYSMWNVNKQRIEMTVPQVKECLATGFALSTNGNVSDSRDLMLTFEKVSAYFEDCLDVEEWSHRMEEVERLHTQYESRKTDTRDRWETILGDPEKSIGLYSCTKKEIDNLYSVIHGICNDVISLYKGVSTQNGQTDLYMHFNQLLNLIKEKAKAKKITEEEKTVIDLLEKRLSKHDVHISACSRNQLGEVINIYLGGRNPIDEDEGDDDEILYGDNPYNEETGKLGYEGVRITSPISQLEAAPVIAGNREIVLALCDSTHMPGTVKEYPWPLSRSLIGQIYKIASPKSKEYLDDFLFVMENTVLADRYLFFMALQNRDVEVTWVGQRQNGKLASPTPYMAIMGKKPCATKNSLLNHDINDYIHVKEAGQPTRLDFKAMVPDDYNPGTAEGRLFIPSEPSQSENQLPEFSRYDATPMEFVFDHSICPYRLVYDYILQEYPYYTSHFHLSFLPSCLMAPKLHFMKQDKRKNYGFIDDSDIDSNRVWDEIEPSFPFLNETEKYEQKYYSMNTAINHFINSNHLRTNGVPVTEEIMDNQHKNMDSRSKGLSRTRMQVLFTEYFGTQVYWDLINLHNGDRKDYGKIRKHLCSLCPHCNTCYFRFNEDRPDVDSLDLPLINLYQHVNDRND